MFHFGGANVPGAPGNLLAGGPSFDINRRPGALGKRSGEQLNRLYIDGTQQNEQLNKELIERGIMPGRGPQLPLVQNGMFGGGVGNIGGMQIAQSQGSFNLLNPMSWFQGQPQRVIREADRGIAPPKGTGSLSENLLRRRAQQAEAMQMLRQ
jgi:hypothetical protein